MHRFIALAGLALLGAAVQAHSKPKPKPPEIQVCTGQVCLIGLRWRRADPDFGRPVPTIEGLLVNRSGFTLIASDLTFALKSGEALTGTAFAIFPSSIATGASWSFSASIMPLPGMRSYTQTESVRLSAIAEQDGERPWFNEEIGFDPLFNPFLTRQIKQWEAIHGKRQR